MRVKYNRVSALGQTGDRFSADKDKYDLVLFDKISGKIDFRERPKGRELAKLVENGRVTELVVQELSRLGRSTGDVVRTLEWLEEREVNVVVKNLGIESRPGGKKNPIWMILGSVLTSLYVMELEHIKERTMVGRQVYVQNGGRLGRPSGSNESELDFLKKEQSQKVIKMLKKGLRIREISKLIDCSPKTIIKVKRIGVKHGQLAVD